MKEKKAPVSFQFWGVSMIVASFLLAISTFFWEGRRYGMTGGTLLVLSLVFWIPTFIGLFDLLREKMPIYATWGLLPAFFGCISGALYGFRDMYADTFHIPLQTELQAFSVHSVSYNLTLFWPGPLFPLSLLVLGFFLVQKRIIAWWVGAFLCLGAVLFPLSRILRIDLLAHGTDLLILVPLLYLGWTFLIGQPARRQ